MLSDKYTNPSMSDHRNSFFLFVVVVVVHSIEQINHWFVNIDNTHRDFFEDNNDEFERSKEWINKQNKEEN